MATLSFRKEMTEQGGRYVATIDGVEGEAEITFVLQGTLIRAEHTNAPETMRGTGAASALVEYMISDARRLGFKIAAECPFVRGQFDRHPEWRELEIIRRD